MFATITFWGYLKNDLKAAFMVFFALSAWMIFVLVAILATLMSDGSTGKGLGEAVAFGLGPLAAFLLILLDTHLLVRRINKAAERKQWVRGKVTKVTVRDDNTVCLIGVVLSQKKRARRKAIVFAGRQARSLKEGSGVDVAEPSLTFFRNPVPLQLLLDSTTLVGQDAQVDLGSGAPSIKSNEVVPPDDASGETRWLWPRE